MPAPAEKLAYRLPSDATPSTRKSGSPEKERVEASNGLASRVPSRLYMRSPSSYVAHDSTCSSTAALDCPSDPTCRRAGCVGGQQVPVTPVYKKWRPSGRKTGKRWLVSPYSASRVVTSTGIPPEAGTV